MLKTVEDLVLSTEERYNQFLIIFDETIVYFDTLSLILKI